MPKKDEDREWEIIAVYTGDSANFHIYQVVNENMVGSIYVNKKVDPLPKIARTKLVNPTDGGVWKDHLNKLLEKTRDGSKAKSKLQKILKEHS